MDGETKDTNKKFVIVGEQEGLLSSSDERTEGFETFLQCKLDSFSGEGLDKLVDVDPTVVLELQDENFVDHSSTGGNVVAVVKEVPRSRVDDMLRSKLREKGISSVSKRPLCVVDVGAAGEWTPKSVAFLFETAGSILTSAGCELVGVSDVGQSFPRSSRSGDTDYSTSELEFIARKRVDDVSGRRFLEAAEVGLPCSSGTTVQHGFSTGRSKIYPNDSARNLLKECFADNSPV